MATKTWVGGTSTDGAVAGNWNPSGVPGTSDDLIFNGDAQRACILKIIQCATIDIQAAFEYNVQFAPASGSALALNAMQVNGQIDSNGAIQLNFSGSHGSGSPYTNRAVVFGSNASYVAQARLNLTFAFNNSGTQYFDDGPYPKVSLVTGGYTFDYATPTSTGWGSVEMISLAVAAGVTFVNTDNRTNEKNIVLTGDSTLSACLTCAATIFNTGNAHLTLFSPQTLPCDDDTTNFGSSGSFQAILKKVTIATHTKDSAAVVPGTFTFKAESLTVENGVKLTGAESTDAGSTIELTTPPVIRGAWNFRSVGGNVFRSGNKVSGHFHTLTVTDKLNVGGVIDPTGLVLDEQSDHPVAAEAGKGILWVKNASPNELWFTNDAGSDAQLGTGGGGGASALNDLSDVSYSSGDLTISSLDTVTFANGGDASINVAATSSGTDGRDLTIEAGSAPAGSADQSGGDLILKAGGGDGTGTSIMTFHTKRSGTDAVVERMRIHTNGNVGIREDDPQAPLHVKYSATDDANPCLLLESTDDGGVSSPDIKLYRNSASPADNDYIGHLVFTGNNDAGTPEEIDYAHIYAIISDYTDGTEDGTLAFRTKVAGANVDVMTIKSGNVGIGTDAPAQPLHVERLSSSTENLMIRFRDSTVNAVGERIGIEGYWNTVPAGHIEWELRNTSSGASDIVFSPHSSGGTTNEVFRITSGGNVGIGTDQPNQPLTVEGTVGLKEQAAANADTAAYGQIWVKTNTPNELWFTDDAGNDVPLAAGGVNAAMAYSASDASKWAGGSPPTTVGAALDRLATWATAVNSAMGGGVGQP